MKKTYAWLGNLLLACMAVSTVFALCWHYGLFTPMPEPDPLPESMTLGVSLNETGDDPASSAIDLTMPLIVSLNGTVQNDGLLYTVHSVTFSKTTQGLPPPLYVSSDVWLTAEGTLVSSHSYVLVEMTMKNTRTSPRMGGGLNSTALAIYNGRERLDNDPDVKITDANPEKQKQKDWFILDTLDAEEELHYTIGYIVEDEWLKNATHLYLAPQDHDKIQQLIESGKADPAWPADAQFILLNDYIKSWDVPETPHVPAAPIPTAESGPFTYGFDDRFHAQVLRASANTAAPMEATMLRQNPGDQPGISGGTLAEGYCCLRVTVEETDVLSTHTLQQAMLGDEKLYCYRDGALLDSFYPYAVWMDETMICTAADLHAQYFSAPVEETYFYTLIYAIPLEYTTGTDLLVLFDGGEIYDPDANRLEWQDDTLFANLAGLLE